MAVIGIIGSAQAVTVNDLMKWGGYCIENTKSDRRHADNGIVRWLSSSVETKFEKISDTQIRLTGMFDAGYSFTFTLANGYDEKTAGQAATDGTQLVLSGNDLYANNARSTFLSYTLWGYNGKASYGIGTDWNIVGEITETETGYKIVFPSFALRFSSSLDLNSMEPYDGYELEIYEPNAWITDDCIDYEQNVNTQYGRRYPGRVDFAEDGTFALKGLAQIGYAISADNQLLPFTGQYDPEKNQSKIDFQHVLFSEDTYNNTTHIGWCDYSIYEVDAAGELYLGVDGTFEDNAYTHKGTNRWVTNDGDCTTENGITMQLEDYVLGCTNSNIYSGLLTTPIFENTRIETTGDCTHAAALSVNSFALSEDGANVDIDATVTPLENTGHVASYDLFIVEGNHSSVNDDFFTGALDAEKGHKDAVLLTSGEYNVTTPATRVAQGTDHNFTLSVPVSALPGDPDSGEGYTMYVRANYTPAIDATFHDMQPIEAVNTGIADLNADRFIGVTAIPGAIRVIGAARAAIYTLDGVAVYDGPAADVAVAPGMYIVRAGNKAVKVIVK